jgi:hypothetical protein
MKVAGAGGASYTLDRVLLTSPSDADDYEHLGFSEAGEIWLASRTPYITKRHYFSPRMTSSSFSVRVFVAAFRCQRSLCSSRVCCRRHVVDRLVIPVPPDNPTEDDKKLWEKWNVKRQAELLEVLGDRARPGQWDQHRRQSWKTRFCRSWCNPDCVNYFSCPAH